MLYDSTFIIFQKGKTVKAKDRPVLAELGMEGRADSEGNMGVGTFPIQLIILLDIQFLEICSCQNPQDYTPQRTYFTVYYFT